MKHKTLLVFFLGLLFFLGGCFRPQEKPKPLDWNEAWRHIQIPDKITHEFTVPTEINVSDHTVQVSCDYGVGFDADGTVRLSINDIESSITVNLFYMGELQTKTFDVIVLNSRQIIADRAFDSLDDFFAQPLLPFTELPSKTAYNAQDLSWRTTKPELLKDSVIQDVTTETMINLTASIRLAERVYSRDYQVTIRPFNKDEQVAYVLENLTLPPRVNSDLQLPTTFKYGLTGTWRSSDETIITSAGVINEARNLESATLTVTIAGLTRSFEVKLMIAQTNFVDNTFTGQLTDVIKTSNNTLKLATGKLSGTYVGTVTDTFPYIELVTSWQAFSSPTAKVELLTRVKVNGQWSKFLSAGAWGYGAKNSSVNDSDSIAAIGSSIIWPRNGKRGEAFQVKAILTRTTASDASPELRSIHTAIRCPDYESYVDITKLRQRVEHDVPGYCQYDHPTYSIGNVICSPTSATILLMSKGHTIEEFAPDPNNITDFDRNYPFANFANIVYDNDTSAYGNWVFNTVAMSNFGEKTYVKRMHSLPELLEHLDKVGPVSISVKDRIIGERGSNWNAAYGHLMVIHGYEITSSGIKLLGTDPAVRHIKEVYTEENFMKFWQINNRFSSVYVIEP